VLSTWDTLAEFAPSIAGMSREALILSMQDLGRWQQKAANGPLPGGGLPYGISHLSRMFAIRWTDEHRRRPVAIGASRSFDRAARLAAPGMQGVVCGWMSRRTAPRASVALSLFENAGLGFARLQGWLPENRRTPHVMLVCWLAEDCQRMTPSQRRSVARSLRSVSRIAVFSANQVSVLAECFGVPAAKVCVVPFGVDVDYYSPSRVGGPAGGGGVVAVGSDSRRDYATLFEAARRSEIPIRVACEPRNLHGLAVPPQVTILSGVYDDAYRRLLHQADLVVTATTGPAYPSGQSVVLEAMAMGRPTLTTDSAAMRDYVRDGIDGVLTPRADPGALARRMSELVDSPDRCAALGKSAQRRVRECFDLTTMWDSLIDVMRAALPPEDR